jgi:hypothetical protein
MSLNARLSWASLINQRMATLVKVTFKKCKNYDFLFVEVVRRSVNFQYYWK